MKHKRFSGDRLDRADLVAVQIGRLAAAEPDLGLGIEQQCPRRRRSCASDRPLPRGN